MKHIIQQVFHSGKFIVGFVILAAVLLIVIVYPLLIKDAPLAIIGQGTFFPPGTYVNVYDSLGSPKYTLNLEHAAASWYSGFPTAWPCRNGWWQLGFLRTRLISATLNSS